MASLHKRKSKRGRGYTYYVRHYRLGKECWKSCGTSDRKLALEIKKKVEEEDERLRQGLTLPESIKHIRLSEFVEKYIVSRVDRFSPRTIQTDRARLDIFLQFIGDDSRFVSSVSSREVERFREKRLREVKPSTVNISLAHLRAAFQWAEDHRYTERNPFAIKNLKIRIDKKIPRAMTPPEIEAFLCGIDEKHKPIFTFLLSTGCRRSEICRLTWEDVDFQSRTITFRNTKGKRDRAIPMTLELAHLLNSLERTGERVFPYNSSWFTHLFRRYRKKAAISNHLTLHSLRHTSATELLRSGVSVYTVQKLLGHSSISVTERYLHAVPSDLREAAEILSKKAQKAG